MKTFIYASIGILLLAACSEVPTGMISKDRTWVYVELETVTFDDTTNYYYFGQMKQDLLESFDKVQELKGLFTLTNVRYYGDNDIVTLYSDERDKGLLIFKIDDIVKIDVLNRDPMLDNEQDVSPEKPLE